MLKIFENPQSRRKLIKPQIKSFLTFEKKGVLQTLMLDRQKMIWNKLLITSSNFQKTQKICISRSFSLPNKWS